MFTSMWEAVLLNWDERVTWAMQTTMQYENNLF